LQNLPNISTERGKNVSLPRIRAAHFKGKRGVGRKGKVEKRGIIGRGPYPTEEKGERKVPKIGRGGL